MMKRTDVLLAHREKKKILAQEVIFLQSSIFPENQVESFGDMEIGPQSMFYRLNVWIVALRRVVNQVLVFWCILQELH